MRALIVWVIHSLKNKLCLPSSLLVSADIMRQTLTQSLFCRNPAELRKWFHTAYRLRLCTTEFLFHCAITYSRGFLFLPLLSPGYLSCFVMEPLKHFGDISNRTLALNVWKVQFNFEHLCCFRWRGLWFNCSVKAWFNNRAWEFNQCRALNQWILQQLDSN